MIDLVSSILGSSASSSFVQYTASILTILSFTFLIKLLARVFNIKF